MTPSVIVIGAGISASRRRMSFIAAASRRSCSRLRPCRRTDPDRARRALHPRRGARLDPCHQVGRDGSLRGTDRPAALISTTSAAHVVVLRNGRLHPLPRPAVLGLPLTWRAAAGATMISGVGRMRMALEPWMPARSIPDESVASFIRRRFGAQASEHLAEPLLAGIHAGDIERLAIQPLFPGLVEAEASHGSVMKGLRARTSQSPRETRRTASFSRYPAGWASWCRRSKRRPARHGKTAYAGGRGSKGRSAVSGSDASGRPALRRRHHCGAGVGRAADARGARRHACRAVRRHLHSSSAIVTLAFDRPAVGATLAGTGFVVPRAERLPIMAATWSSSKWSGRAPADGVLMRAFLGGARDPGAVDRSDQDLIEAALRALTPIARLTGSAALHAHSPLAARVATARGRPSPASRNDRAAARRMAGLVPHRQRVTASPAFRTASRMRAR